MHCVNGFTKGPCYKLYIKTSMKIVSYMSQHGNKFKIIHCVNGSTQALYYKLYTVLTVVLRVLVTNYTLC